MSFSIRENQEKGYKTLRLSEDEEGLSVDIAPFCGAMLDGFRIRTTEGTINLIDSYASLEDCKDGIRKNFKGVKLSPYVCRLGGGKYTLGGRTYQMEKNSLAGEAIHGLLYDRAFKENRRKISDNSATLQLQIDYKGEDAGYPFPYRCQVEYSIYRDNRLTMDTWITNLSDTAIPVVDGWHPYFRTGTKVDELELQFTAEAFVEFDTDLIPTGKLLPYREFNQMKKIGNIQLDNSFLLDISDKQPRCVLSDPMKKISVEFYPDPAYQVLQLYIPPQRDSIAIELLSGVPDAFNNGMGLKMLQPDAIAHFSITLVAKAL